MSFQDDIMQGVVRGKSYQIRQFGEFFQEGELTNNLQIIKGVIDGFYQQKLVILPENMKDSMNAIDLCFLGKNVIVMFEDNDGNIVEVYRLGNYQYGLTIENVARSAAQIVGHIHARKEVIAEQDWQFLHNLNSEKSFVVLGCGYHDVHQLTRVRYLSQKTTCNLLFTDMHVMNFILAKSAIEQRLEEDDSTFLSLPDTLKYPPLSLLDLHDIGSIFENGCNENVAFVMSNVFTVMRPHELEKALESVFSSGVPLIVRDIYHPNSAALDCPEFDNFFKANLSIKSVLDSISEKIDLEASFEEFDSFVMEHALCCNLAPEVMFVLYYRNIKRICAKNGWKCDVKIHCMQSDLWNDREKTAYADYKDKWVLIDGFGVTFASTKELPFPIGNADRLTFTPVMQIYPEGLDMEHFIDSSSYLPWTEQFFAEGEWPLSAEFFWFQGVGSFELAYNMLTQVASADLGGRERRHLKYLEKIVSFRNSVINGENTPQKIRRSKMLSMYDKLKKFIK